MIRSICIALLIAALPLAAVAQEPGSQEFLQKLQLASIFDARGDYQNSSRLYEELYHLQPDNPDILFGYVRVLTALKRFTTADSVLTDALSHPTNQAYDLYLLLGKTRSMLGRKADALDAFHKAIDAGSGQNPYSLTYAVSQAMSDVGYTDEALKLLQDHRKNEQDGQFYTPLIGDLLFRMGKYDLGTREFLSLLRSNDKSASIGNILASIEGRISRFTADTASNRTIIRTVIAQINTETDNIAELELLEWCYGELRNYDGGLDVALRIDGLRDQKDNGFALMQFADKAISEGAFDAASRAYAAAAQRAEEHTTPDTRTELYYDAKLGVLRAKLAALERRVPRDDNAIRAVVTEYASLGTSPVTPTEIALEALDLAGDAALNTLHDPALAKPYYEAIVKRSTSMPSVTRDAYFALESIALAQNQIDVARNELEALSTLLDRRRRSEDIEIRRHIQFEKARIFYFEGRFDTALATLTPIVAASSSEFANDAIAMQSLISENREGPRDAALTVFSKAELLSLGADLPTALAGYQSIAQTNPKPAIADEAILRAADLLVRLGKPSDAVLLLENMQDTMTDSPLLDRAAMRQAEITEHELHSKDKALTLYQDFLARYPKSPLCTEVRQRARRLRGDIF
ncbi:MAG: tetratricopeptide repeat protein [Bacteroidetes bacterium]|nr:tetratricopeptide repeat protein [Bacteroidota bacterium]